MYTLTRFQIVLALVMTAIMGIMGVVVVNAVYQARTLFVQYDKLERLGTKLRNENAELLWQVRRASLPAKVFDDGTEIGLVSAGDKQTLSLVVPDHMPTVDFSKYETPASPQAAPDAPQADLPDAAEPAASPQAVEVNDPVSMPIHVPVEAPQAGSESDQAPAAKANTPAAKANAQAKPNTPAAAKGKKTKSDKVQQKPAKTSWLTLKAEVRHG